MNYQWDADSSQLLLSFWTNDSILCAWVVNFQAEMVVSFIRWSRNPLYTQPAHFCGMRGPIINLLRLIDFYTYHTLQKHNWRVIADSKVRTNMSNWILNINVFHKVIEVTETKMWALNVPTKKYSLKKCCIYNKTKQIFGPLIKQDRPFTTNFKHNQHWCICCHKSYDLNCGNMPMNAKGSPPYKSSYRFFLLPRCCMALLSELNICTHESKTKYQHSSF